MLQCSGHPLNEAPSGRGGRSSALNGIRHGRGTLSSYLCRSSQWKEIVPRSCDRRQGCWRSSCGGQVAPATGAGGRGGPGLPSSQASLHFLLIFSFTRLTRLLQKRLLSLTSPSLSGPWPSMPSRLFSHHPVLLPWHPLPKTILSDSAQATAPIGRNLPTVSPNTSSGPGTARHRYTPRALEMPREPANHVIIGSDL